MHLVGNVTLRDLYTLSKGKLSLIVTATGAAGFVAGSGDVVDYGKMACMCLGTFACSAAANTFNQVYEIRNDSLMRRTMLRPLPAGRLSVVQALCFAAITTVGGTALLAYQVWLQMFPGRLVLTGLSDRPNMSSCFHHQDDMSLLSCL
jgi:heme O synthase-like polyprenyltransferase